MDAKEVADVGLFLLRLVVGMLIIGHAVQKSVGWFGGDGIATTATVFDRIGYSPGRLMVLIASGTEIVGSLLLIVGALTPLAGAVLVGVMIVACSVHWQFGIWAVNRGFELPLTFAVVAATLALTGAGGWSVDDLIGVEFPAWVPLVSLLASCLGAAGLIGIRALRLRGRARSSVSATSR